MKYVVKLYECGKGIQNDDIKQMVGAGTELEYVSEAGTDQHKDQKDVTKSLNEIILKQLFY